MLPPPGVANHHVIWTSFFVFALILRIMTLLASVPVLVILFSKRRFFPKVALWYYPLIVLPGLVFYALLLGLGPDSFPSYAATYPASSLSYTLFALVGIAVWTLYFRHSKRVKNTFVK